MALFIDSIRDCSMYAMTSNWLLLGIWFVISFILAVFGVWNIYRYENTYVKVI